MSELANLPIELAEAQAERDELRRALLDALAVFAIDDDSTQFYARYAELIKRARTSEVL
jgi:hypothetical protein